MTNQFVGYLNVRTFLDRVAPTFPDVTDVLVAGVSAGGFGAAANAEQIQRVFPDVPAKLIDDSGPPMGSEYLTSCLQQTWRDTWGLENSMIGECGADCPDPDDFVADYGVHLAKTFSNRLSGLIETTEDNTISGFFGAGTDPLGFGPCTGLPLVTPVAAADFKRGLLEFRASVQDYPNFGTYYAEGTQHTWLSSPSFYTGSIGETKLVDWVSDIVNDVGASHVGPTLP